MYIINTPLKKIKTIALFIFCSLTFYVYANEAEDWFDKGYAASQLKDYKKAVKWYLKAAEQGHADAQINLALMYDIGQVVAQDYKRAAKWYLKAAEQGDAGAQFNIALLYKIGQGVPKDYEQAAKWYLKVAEQGPAGDQFFIADAQITLALMYSNGQGVMQSNKKSYIWNAIAAANGYKSALKNRDINAKSLSPRGLKEAQEEASKLYDKINSKK
ncbi:MAG: tetratricopeptide repeat protein [Colwellia sp.]